MENILNVPDYYLYSFNNFIVLDKSLTHSFIQLLIYFYL